MKTTWIVVAAVVVTVLAGVGCLCMGPGQPVDPEQDRTTITIEPAVEEGRPSAKIEQKEVRVKEGTDVSYDNASEVEVRIDFGDCPELFMGKPGKVTLLAGEKVTFTVLRNGKKCGPAVSRVVLGEDGQEPDIRLMGGPVLIPYP